MGAGKGKTRRVKSSGVAQQVALEEIIATTVKEGKRGFTAVHVAEQGGVDEQAAYRACEALVKEGKLSKSFQVLCQNCGRTVKTFAAGDDLGRPDMSVTIDSPEDLLGMEFECLSCGDMENPPAEFYVDRVQEETNTNSDVWTSYAPVEDWKESLLAKEAEEEFIRKDLDADKLEF